MKNGTIDLAVDIWPFRLSQLTLNSSASKDKNPPHSSYDFIKDKSAIALLDTPGIFANFQIFETTERSKVSRSGRPAPLDLLTLSNGVGFGLCDTNDMHCVLPPENSLARSRNGSESWAKRCAKGEFGDVCDEHGMFRPPQCRSASSDCLTIMHPSPLLEIQLNRHLTTVLKKHSVLKLQPVRSSTIFAESWLFVSVSVHVPGTLHSTRFFWWHLPPHTTKNEEKTFGKTQNSLQER